MGDSPAYAITPGWSIVAWNPAYEAFYANIATVVPEDRNLLWLVFTDHHLRTMLTDWDADSRRFLAQFRAETWHRVHQPTVTRLVVRLQAVSQEFRNRWADHDLEQFISRERTFTHPTVGDLLLEHHRLSLSDCPGVNLIMYTASPDTGTAEKLAQLRIRETPESE